MDSEISGLENRHAFLKLGNNVARFHFEYMDVALTTPGFVPRKVEDDELPFDPKTLVPKASALATPSIDLEAATPISPQSPTPQVATDDEEDAEADEPTAKEIASSGADRDSPDDDQEEDVPVAADEPMRV